MKTLQVIALSIGVAFAGYSQTATFQARQEVEKVQYDGVSASCAVDDKFVGKDWEAYLTKFGRVATARGGTYKVAGANMPSVQAEPVNILSRVTNSRGVTQVFMAVDLGNNNFVTAGTFQYTEVENLLKKFMSLTLLNEEQRVAEKAVEESQKNHQKLVKSGDRLVRDIDKTTKELEQLKKDLEQNKTDQTNGLTDIDTKRKAVEVVKGKFLKN